MEKTPFKLDRSAFSIQNFNEAEHNRAYWLQQTPAERLAAAWYLICCAWNIDHAQPPLLDRTVFSMRKQLEL